MNVTFNIAERIIFIVATQTKQRTMIAVAVPIGSHILSKSLSGINR